MAVSPNTDFTSGQILTATQQNNFPRGVMAYAISTSSPTVTTTKADVTNMTATWTAVANRLYRATFEGFVGMSGSASQSQFFFADAANTEFDSWFQDIPANSFMCVNIQYLFTTTAGSKTLKLRAVTSAGTMTFYGNGGRTSSFVIEDLGPA